MDVAEFKKLEKEYNQLWMEGKQEEALEKAEVVAKRYPEEEYITTLDRALLNLELGKEEKAKKLLNIAQEKGYWYPEVYLEPIFKNDNFQEIVTRWKELKEEHEARAEAKYLIFLPEKYHPEESYPLFVALHGWGESAEFFAYYWNSDKIKENYILVLPQSAQIIGSYNYCWNDEKAAHREINEMMEKIKEDYLINEEDSIVGGFSQGGGLAIDTALKQDYLTVKGFISLCPVKPESFSDQLVKRAAGKGLKGVIITGEHDQSLPDQKEMDKSFKKNNLSSQLIVEDGLGHWFPDDLKEQLDRALEFINN